jgi:peptidyl-prolyl cis-trans isomerase SurA
LPYYPTEVEVRQIVRFPKLEQQDKAAIIERLQTLKARIQAGESFVELAKQYSEDGGSANNGGELGFWRIGELTPAYEAAILSSKPGDIVGPIETPFGFHLIQLLERQTDRYNSRHILLKSHKSKAAIEAEITYLQGIRAGIIEKQMTFEKAALLYSEDAETRYQGGLLNRSAQGNKTPLGALPPDVFLIIDRLQPGEISAVNEFNTTTGEQAIRILYLKQRIPGHQANLQQDYEKIYQMALDNKKDLALKQWFKNIKEETNLQIDPAYQNCSILQ